MPDRAARRRAAAPPLAPRVKVWLEAGGRYAFGYGVGEILLAVDRAGSLKHAARALGKSYRYVWGRVKKTERDLGVRLVETQVGGRGDRRSALTPEARELVDAFMALRARMIEAVAEEFGRRFGPPAARD
jgi:molybdate transport system regulatory protein